MRGSEKWLREYRKKHPERVNDPSEDTDGTIIRRARWEFEEMPPLFNRITGMLQYEPAEYYKTLNRWANRFAVKARGEAGANARLVTPLAVEMTRKSTRTPDLDGLYGSLKIPLDALIRAGLIPDDDPGCVASVECFPQRVNKQTEQGTIFVFRPAGQ